MPPPMREAHRPARPARRLQPHSADGFAVGTPEMKRYRKGPSPKHATGPFDPKRNTGVNW